MKGVGGGAAAGPPKAKQQGDTPNKGGDASVEFKSIKDIAAAFNNNPIPTNPPPATATTSTSNPLSAITNSVNNIKEAVLSITPFTKDKDNKDTKDQKDNKEKDKDRDKEKEKDNRDKDNKDKDKDKDKDNKDNKDKDKDKDKEGKDKSPNTTKASADGGTRRVIGGTGKEPSTLQVNPIRPHNPARNTVSGAVVKSNSVVLEKLEERNELRKKLNSSGDNRKQLLLSLNDELVKYSDLVDKLNEEFIVPLNNAKPPILSLNEFQSIASVFIMIVGYNKILKQDCQKVVDGGTCEPLLDSIGSFMRFFCIYAQGVNSSLMAYKSQLYENPRFSALAKKCEANMKRASASTPLVVLQPSRFRPVDIATLMTTHLDPINVDFSYDFQDIPSILVLPTIFISRYVGRLGSFGNTDRLLAPLQECITALKSIIPAISAQLKVVVPKAEGGATFRSDEFVESRRLIKEGKLKDEYAIVFNDLLVITDLPDKDGNCNLRRAIPMSDLKFANNTGLGHENKFVLNVKDNAQLVLEAATLDDKFTWMAAVIGAIQKVATSPAIIISNLGLPPADGEVTVEASDRAKELDGSVLKAISQNQIRHIDLSNQTVKLSDMSQLVTSLAPNSILSTITFSNCGGVASALSDQAYNLMASLSQFIGYSQRLTILTFSGCSLTTIHGIHLAAALRVNATVTSLDVSDNLLRSLGTKALLDAVITHPSLTHLNVSKNQAQSDGGLALAVVLRHNTTLECVKAGDNDFPAPALNAIRAAVIANKAAVLESLDVGVDIDQEPELAASLTANKERTAKSKTRLVDKSSLIDLGYRFEAEPAVATFENILKSEFPKHPTITQIYLDHNRMASLPEPLIASFKRFVPTLRSLTLCHNLLPALPAVLGTLTGLTTLDVSYNKIKEWPMCVSKLEQLTVLDLSHNEIELISPDANMQVLTKLTTLILASNSFPTIPNSVLSLPSLTTLSISGNLAVPVPKQRLLEYIPLKIATLDFSNLGISALPMEIGRLTSLNYLDVSNNKLKFIPPQIGLLHSLTYLDLSNNNLETVAWQINSLAKLDCLKLGGNVTIVSKYLAPNNMPEDLKGDAVSMNNCMNSKGLSVG